MGLLVRSPLVNIVDKGTLSLAGILHLCLRTMISQDSRSQSALVDVDTASEVHSLVFISYSVVTHTLPCHFSTAWRMNWRVKATGTGETPRTGFYVMETFFPLQVELWVPAQGREFMQGPKGSFDFRTLRGGSWGCQFWHLMLWPSLHRTWHTACPS